MSRDGSFPRMALAVVVALAWAVLPMGAAHGQEAGSGRSACRSCHPGVDGHYDAALRHAPSVTCLSCHHVGSASNPAAARDPALMAARRTEACVGCHRTVPVTHPQLARNGTPGCTTCHNIHGDPTLVGRGLVADRLCTLCHGRRHTLHATVVAGGPTCRSCHTLHSTRPIEAGMSEKCESCHPGVHPMHATAIAQGKLQCPACHGVDAAPAVAQVKSRLNGTCRSCHGAVHSSHAMWAGAGGPECTDCHDFDRDPPVARAGPIISQRCGACHPQELADFKSGAHAAGIAPTGANTDLPNCTTCHEEHGAGTSRASIRLVATERCIGCHSKGKLSEKYGLKATVGASYVDDFHGSTVVFLGNPATAGGTQAKVLVCSDCHGAHAVGWKPGKTVSSVCLECHRKANVKLASAWLGHGIVSPSNHALVWVIRLFYHIFIPFVLAGLFLNILFHLSDQRRRGARLLDSPGVKKLRRWLSGRREREKMVTRFTGVQRLEHVAAIVIFTLLVVTGLPQTAPGAAWADRIIAAFGGIGTTRIIHRICGFAFVTLLVQHVARGALGIVRTRRWPDIAPRRQDFIDTVQTVRHYLTGAPKPRLGKFDASEKFEYWGLFLGGVLMSVTGLVLVFPGLVSHLLPGSAVAAMRVMHGLEATFAVLVVLLWHSYGVILRPEIFPLDTSIFTGKISVERMREEHELAYDALRRTRPPAATAGAAKAAEAAETGVSPAAAALLSAGASGASSSPRPEAGTM